MLTVVEEAASSVTIVNPLGRVDTEGLLTEACDGDVEGSLFGGVRVGER